MISIKIPEVKTFMAKLLTNAAFDSFILRELELQTFTNFKITGLLNEEFFSNEELEEREAKSYVLWSEIRPIAFSMIKGNKTPLALRIVFQLPIKSCEELIKSSGIRLATEDVGGLYLNIRFEKGELHIITGTAIKTFTLDKTLEQEWDKEIKNILKNQGIIYEEE